MEEQINYQKIYYPINIGSEVSSRTLIRTERRTIQWSQSGLKTKLIKTKKYNGLSNLPLILNSPISRIDTLGPWSQIQLIVSISNKFHVPLRV